jgi:hypothetical protein
MIEPQYELDMYPMVKNRSVVNIYPTKIYLDWLNYIRGSDVSLGLNDIEPISFLIQDFETRNQFVAPHSAPPIKKVPENQRLNFISAVRTVGMKQI